MTLTILLMSALVLFCGIAVAVTPWLMPPTECFAVTVPPSARQDPRIKGYLRSYTGIICAVTVACTLALAGLLTRLLAGDPASTETAVRVSTAISVATFVPLILAMGLMLYYRSRVRALKQAEGWTATTQQAATIISEDIPQPISLAWNLLYVPLTLAMVAFAFVMYDRFPEQIPMNIELTGEVSNYAPKSIGSVLFPALIVGYMGLIFTVSHWFIIISKRPIDPAAPASSAYAYGRFARMQSIAILVGGLLLSAGIGCTYYLSALEIVPLSTALIVLTIIILLFVGAMLLISMRYGQSGARLASELRTSDELANDDDEHWILGTFYCNRDDASVVVPKRFGIGWTINCASPIAWLSFAVIMLVTFGFVLLTNQMMG